MRVLFVHEVSYLDKVVFEMHEFPELLALRGHDVSFVDFPERQRTQYRRRYQKKVVRGRAFGDATISLYSIPNLLVEPLGRLLATALSFRSVKRIIKDENPDVIVLYGVPTNGLQTIRAAKQCGIPVVHRAIDVSHLLRPGLLSKLVPPFERLVYVKSDVVLANNEALAEYVRKKSGNRAQPKILYPGVKDLKLIHDTATKRYDFVFMGTLFRFGGLAWFIEAFARDPRFNECTLLIVGDGEAGSELRDLVVKFGLSDRVTFTGFVPFDDLPQHVSSACIGILTFDELPVARLALPGKVFQYLSFGIPTVSTRLDGLMACLSQTQGVIYAAPGTDYMDALHSLWTNAELCDEIVQRGRQRLSQVAYWPKVIRDFERILQETIDQS